MQGSGLILLALGLGHLLGDFVLQSERDVHLKAAFDPWAYARHAAIHYACTLLSLALFAALSPASAGVQVAMVALIAAHTLIDVGKTLVSRVLVDRYVLSVFLLDQVAHVVTLVLVGGYLLADVPASSALAWGSPAIVYQYLVFLVTYIGVVMAGSHIIHVALLPFAPEIGDADEGKQLAYAGLYIGRLERFLMLSALLAGSYTAVGLIVGAKSIFRFPAMKDRPFAEYFLVGTLFSVTIAVLGAMFLRVMIG